MESGQTRTNQGAGVISSKRLVALITMIAGGVTMVVLLGYLRP